MRAEKKEKAYTFSSFCSFLQLRNVRVFLNPFSRARHSSISATHTESISEEFFHQSKCLLILQGDTFKTDIFLFLESILFMERAFEIPQYGYATNPIYICEPTFFSPYLQLQDKYDPWQPGTLQHLWDFRFF